MGHLIYGPFIGDSFDHQMHELQNINQSVGGETRIGKEIIPGSKKWGLAWYVSS